MKKFILIFLLLSLNVFIFANNTTNNFKQAERIVASTSWTAAFADLAGVDSVTSIAPATLQHPPEYEITVSDIQTINNSTIFIYAGFERMMKTIGNAVGNTQMVKITCDNSIDTVTKSTQLIADITGTQKQRNIRLAKYIATINDAANQIKKLNLQDVNILCNKNQIYLAKDLGFTNITIFGPGPVTSEQIANANKTHYEFIIDNIHNPVGSPLLEVSPSSKYVIWRNFPEAIERDALLHVIQSNINSLLK